MWSWNRTAIPIRDGFPVNSAYCMACGKILGSTFTSLVKNLGISTGYTSSSTQARLDFPVEVLPRLCRQSRESIGTIVTMLGAWQEGKRASERKCNTALRSAYVSFKGGLTGRRLGIDLCC